MDTCTLLVPGAFAGLLVHFAFYGISTLVTGRRKSIVNGPAAEKESVPEKNASVYSAPTRVYIPDILSNWPWPRRINPHHAVVRKESDAWIASFRVFSPKAQHAFYRSNSGLLGCLAYPIASKEHLRVACDLMNLLFIIDEYSDVAEPDEVRKQKDIMMDALRNPHKPRPKAEWICGEMVRQYWELVIHSASEQSQKRFIQKFEKYLDAVVQQAIDRKTHHIRNIEDYIDLRRHGTGALGAAFVMLELGLNIPDEVLSHPAIQEMDLASTDMICINNDILSHNLEQCRGDDTHNIVTIVMKIFDTDVNGAMLWLQDFHKGLEKRFHAAMAALPQWDEPLNSQVKEYCDGLANWVRANDDWSFEGGRYFGNRGLEIKEKRWISLFPKERERMNGTAEIGPMLIDSSLL